MSAEDFQPQKITVDPIFEDLDNLDSFIVPHSPWPMHNVTVPYEIECISVIHKEIPFLLSDGELAALWDEYSEEEWCAGWMNVHFIRLDHFLGWLKKQGETGILSIYEQSPRRTQ